jgi:hypothetical protein
MTLACFVSGCPERVVMSRSWRESVTLHACAWHREFLPRLQPPGREAYEICPDCKKDYGVYFRQYPRVLEVYCQGCTRALVPVMGHAQAVLL